MATVLAMLLFVACFFALFGMAFYQRSFRRRCVTLPAAAPSCAAPRPAFDAPDAGAPVSWDLPPACSLAAWAAPAPAAPAAQISVAGGYPFETWCKVCAPLPLLPSPPRPPVNIAPSNQSCRHKSTPPPLRPRAGMAQRDARAV